MNQSVTTALPVPSRHRRTFVAIALIPVLAIGAGLGIAALASGGSESAVSRSAPATPPVIAARSTVVELCGTDVTDLLATIAAMPPSAQAQVVGSLSPELFVALTVDSSNSLAPAPDNATLGRILTHLGLPDRNAIVRRASRRTPLRRGRSGAVGRGGVLDLGRASEVPVAGAALKPIDEVRRQEARPCDCAN